MRQQLDEDYFCLLCRRWTWQATCPKCGHPTQYDAAQAKEKIAPVTQAQQDAALARLIFGN